MEGLSLRTKENLPEGFPALWIPLKGVVCFVLVGSWGIFLDLQRKPPGELRSNTGGGGSKRNPNGSQRGKAGSWVNVCFLFATRYF